MNNQKELKIVVYIALLTVIGFILNIIEIPYLIPWLRLDVSEVVTLIGASIAPVIGFGVAILKALLMSITGSTTGFVGELTLLIGSITIILLYVIFKKITNELIALIVVIFGFTLVMTVLNYFIITPFYLGVSYQSLSSSTQTINNMQVSYLGYILILYVPFNLIKITLDVVIFYILNNRLKKVL